MRIKSLTLLVAAAATIALTGQSCKKDISAERTGKTYDQPTAPDYIPGVEFVKVPTTLFTFNETPEGRLVEGADGKAEVAQQAFWISKEPVPASFYEAYMGKGKYPGNGLSYDDIEKLLDRAYLSTGLPLVLPTEAMLEAAMANEEIKPLEAYRLIVADGWSDRGPESELYINYHVPVTGSKVVCRTRFKKEAVERFRARSINRFHLAMNIRDERSVDRLFSDIAPCDPEPSDGKAETFRVGETLFTMMPVQGGTMTLGATDEQGKYAELDEGPAHQVTLGDFKIGQTEVTAGLWHEVMGYYPVGNLKSEPLKPVTFVSWYDAQEFLLKLRQLTGRPFRLPSEDEWEYAARGGVKSKGYVFSGSNDASQVAVCTTKDRKGEPVRPRSANVASKKANELGIYDMSGSAWEWVQGSHPDGGAVLRGGSRLSMNVACRVSNRQGMDPMAKKDTFGFRLAL